MSNAPTDPAVPSPASWARLHDAAVVVPLPSIGSLRLTGPDRVDFLNGQLANDVRGTAVGEARRSLYLDVRGHALDEVRIHRRRDDLHVAVEDGGAASVLERLAAHRVFDDVELHDLGDVLRCFTVQGPEAGGVLHDALGVSRELRDDGFEQRPVDGRDVLVSPHRRSRPGGADVFVLARDAERVHGTLLAAGASRGDLASLEASRVDAGLARARSDAGAGVLPQEARLADAISTRKGCYLGQETMARIEARATLRRDLRRLRLDQVPVGAEARPDVMLDGRTVGRLGTVARHPELGWIALAVVRTDLEPDATLSIGSARAAILPA